MKGLRQHRSVREVEEEGACQKGKQPLIFRQVVKYILALPLGLLFLAATARQIEVNVLAFDE